MGKKVLITGSGTGLGLSLCQKFLSEGWSVIAHHFEVSDDFLSMQKKVSKEKLVPLYVDFSDDKEFLDFLGVINKHDIDALVNNSGVHDYSGYRDQDLGSIDKIFRINTIRPILLAKRVLESMKKRKSGSIINIGSIGVKYGSNINSVFYSASKSGLETATKSLAREAASHGVLVNTVRPGVINTDFFRSLGKDEEARKSLIPLKRFAQADEVSELVWFLCSKNTYITNEVISISGGE